MFDASFFILVFIKRDDYFDTILKFRPFCCWEKLVLIVVTNKFHDDRKSVCFSFCVLCCNFLTIIFAKLYHSYGNFNVRYSMIFDNIAQHLILNLRTVLNNPHNVSTACQNER